MMEPDETDRMLEAAFSAAEREVGEGDFAARVARRVRRRARLRIAAVSASALAGVVVAAPQAAQFVIAVGERLGQSASSFSGAPAWIVAAAAAVAVLDAVLPFGFSRAPRTSTSR